MISLENANNCVFNDSFSFIAPSKEGLYEVTGFIIYNPFLKESAGISSVEHSIRFTLEVIAD